MTLRELESKRRKPSRIGNELKKLGQQNDTTETEESAANIQEKENTLFKLHQDLIKAKIFDFNKRCSLVIECDAIQNESQRIPIISTLIIPSYHARGSPFTNYEPETETFFDVNTSFLQQISLKITSQNGTAVTGGIAQPTIVVLKFKKMQKTAQSHNIFVSSTGSDAADFKVQLPEHVLQAPNTQWEIALTRISFLPMFDSFPKDNQYLSIHTGKTFLDFLAQKGVDSNKATQKDYEDYRFTTHRRNKSFYYKEEWSTAQLCDFIGSTLNVMSIDLESPLQFKYNDKEKGVTIRSQKALSIYAPALLIHILGFEGQAIFLDNGYAILPTKANLLEMKNDRPVDRNFMDPQSLLIYTDCVAPSIVGNVYGQYLTHVPILKKTSEKTEIEYFSHEPKNLEFHALQQKDLNNVHFKFLQVDGKKPNFSSTSITSHMSILFREIKT